MKFNIGSLVQVVSESCMQGYHGVVVKYNHSFNAYLIAFDKELLWFSEFELAHTKTEVQSISIQTCIAYLTSNGYKVTLEKL